MTASADRVRSFLDDLACADEDRLVALAQQARHVPRPPAFRGRCLDTAFLGAVAAGEWTPDDEGLLDTLVQRVEAANLRRVSWRHRRALSRALRAAAVSLLTEGVACSAWQRRRSHLACAWTSTIGPLPTG